MSRRSRRNRWRGLPTSAELERALQEEARSFLSTSTYVAGIDPIGVEVNVMRMPHYDNSTSVGAGLFEQIDPHNYTTFTAHTGYWDAQTLRETFTRLANDRPAPARDVTIMTGEAGMNIFNESVGRVAGRIENPYQDEFDRLKKLGYTVKVDPRDFSSKAAYKLYYEEDLVAEFTATEFDNFLRTIE
jgi:hypothetical protein